MLDQIKSELLKICLSIVHEQVLRLNLAKAEIQRAANEETKSSAGDKYETARAMAQQEIEKLTRRQAETDNFLKVLSLIENHKGDSKIGLGSLVVTDSDRYFISIPLGKIAFEEKEWICLSPGSPLGSKMIGLKLNDTYSWNGKIITILAKA